MREALIDSPVQEFAARSNIGEIVETDPIEEELVQEPEEVPLAPVPEPEPEPEPIPTPTETETATSTPTPTETPISDEEPEISEPPEVDD